MRRLVTAAHWGGGTAGGVGEGKSGVKSCGGRGKEMDRKLGPRGVVSMMEH